MTRRRGLRRRRCFLLLVLVVVVVASTPPARDVEEVLALVGVGSSMFDGRGWLEEGRPRGLTRAC